MTSFVVQRRVEFADTDMGGIMHFSRFFVYMETAEHRFLESLGTSVTAEHEGRKLGWPRVSASCEYRSPARFGQTLDIHVGVERKGEKSMTYTFSFRQDGREIATGKMTSVCCVLDPSRQEVRSISIPEPIRRKLDGAGA